MTEKPPEFVRRLSDTRATAGDRAVFEIELSKGDAVTKWYREIAGGGSGVELDFSSRVRLSIDGKKQRLEIDGVGTADAGEYACTVPGGARCAKR